MSLDSLSKATLEAIQAGKDALSKGSNVVSSLSQDFGRAALIAGTVATAGCSDELPKLNECVTVERVEVMNSSGEYVETENWGAEWAPTDEVKDEFGNESWWFSMKVVPDFSNCGAVEVTGVHALYAGHDKSADVTLLDEGDATQGVEVDGDNLGTFQGAPLGEIQLHTDNPLYGDCEVIEEEWNCIDNSIEFEPYFEKGNEYMSYGHIVTYVTDCDEELGEEGDGYTCNLIPGEAVVTTNEE